MRERENEGAEKSLFPTIGKTGPFLPSFQYQTRGVKQQKDYQMRWEYEGAELISLLQIGNPD